MRKFLAREDTRKLVHLDEESYQTLLSSLKKNKASDIYNVQLEHLLYASRDTSSYMVDLINQILDQPDLYCHTAISRSIASMLHKGKNRPKDKIGNYRRIQICTLSQKIIQKIIAAPAGEMVKDSMVPTQWGFTPKVSFLTATFVRETLSKLAFDNNINVFLISSDVEAAFSRTERLLQLYELSRQGEAGKILQFSDSFYTNTDVVMSSGSSFSPLFSEHRGAGQGTLLAPGHWKVYSVPLYQMLTSSGLGVRLAGEDWSCISVADDTITVTDSRHKMEIISSIYLQYGKEYGVKYSYDKTHVNVYGRGNIEELTKDMEFGGSRIGISHESDHLGLKVTQNLSQTNNRNVENRISKANSRLFQIMGRSFRRRYPLTHGVTRTLMRSVLSPMLASGLQALCLNVTSTKRIQRANDAVLRRTYAVGKISPSSPLLLMLSHLPMEANIHMQALGLFNNIWSLPGPAKNLLVHLFENKNLKMYHWSAFLSDICQQYDIPDPAKIIKLPHVSKEKWARMIKTKVVDFHEKKLQKKIHRSSLYEFIHAGDFTLKRSTLHPILSAAKTNREILGMQITLKHLIMEAPVASNLYRKKLISSPECRYCPIKGEPDDTAHMLTTCLLTRESDAARYARFCLFEQLHMATGLSENTLLSRFWTEKDAMALTILNPLSSSCHSDLHIEEDNPHLTQVILAAQFLVLVVTSLRFRQDVRTPSRRKGGLKGGKSGHHSRKTAQAAKGKGKSFTKLNKTYQMCVLSQVSTKPSENPDLRYAGTIKRSPGGTLTRSKMSLIAAVTAPGLVPVLITAPGQDESNARFLRKKTVIWSSHEHQSWNKAIQMITGYSDVAENLNFVLIEAFPAAEAAKLTALAPIQWKPEDTDPVDCPHHKDAVMPIIMVVCNHDLPICSWFLDSTPEMETIILAPNVAPTHRGDTLLSQTFQELSTADQTTFNVQGRVLGRSVPIEDIRTWVADSLEKSTWTLVRMNDPTTDTSEMMWKLSLTIMEWAAMGKARRLEAQAKLKLMDDASLSSSLAWDHADNLTITRGGRQQQLMHPIEFLGMVVGRRSDRSGFDTISPVRPSRASGASRMSSTPSASASAHQDGQNLETKLDNITDLLRKVSTVVKGKDRRQEPGYFNTSSEADISNEARPGPSGFSGRHSTIIKSIAEKNEETKRKRADCSKYQLLNLNDDAIESILSGSVCNGPNGTITLSSGEEETPEKARTPGIKSIPETPMNLVIKTKGEDRTVSAKPCSNDDSSLMISSAESSPDLRDARSPTEPDNGDARYRISGDLRFKIENKRLTSTRRLEFGQMEDTMANSPMRRPNLEETSERPASSARSQSQRRKIGKEAEEEDSPATMEATAPQPKEEIKSEPEPEKPKFKPVMIVADDDELESFAKDLEATGKPEEIFQAIMAQVAQTGEATLFVPKGRSGSSRDPRLAARVINRPPKIGVDSDEIKLDENMDAPGENIMRDDNVEDMNTEANNNTTSSSTDSAITISDSSDISDIQERGPRQGSAVPASIFTTLMEEHFAPKGLKKALQKVKRENDTTPAQYQEKLRQGQFEDSITEMEVSLNDGRPEEHDNTAAASSTDTTDDAINIVGHSDSTDFSMDQVTQVNPSGATSDMRSLDDTVHDTYDLVEQGQLIGTAKVHKEARTSTKSGRVSIHPIYYADDTLDPTGGEERLRILKEMYSRESLRETSDDILDAIDQQLAEYDSDTTGMSNYTQWANDNCEYERYRGSCRPGGGHRGPRDHQEQGGEIEDPGENDFIFESERRSGYASPVMKLSGQGPPYYTECNHASLNYTVTQTCSTERDVLEKVVSYGDNYEIEKSRVSADKNDKIPARELKLKEIKPSDSDHIITAPSPSQIPLSSPPPPTPNLQNIFIRSFICSSIIDTLLHYNLITFLSLHFPLHPREGHHVNPATVGGYPSRFQAVHATGASHMTINVS